MGLVPGNRVLLRAPNSPMLAACWFAVVKAGGIAVGSMPLLRAKELKQILDKAQISHALCDLRLAEEMKLAAADCPQLRQLRFFNDDSAEGLEAAMARQSATFTNVATAADDTCLMAFTSGTTGAAQGHDAFPPRRDGRLRLLAAARAAADRRTTSSSAARRWPSPSAWAACCCSR